MQTVVQILKDQTFKIIVHGFFSELICKYRTVAYTVSKGEQII
jgi:hypothetical protein